MENTKNTNIIYGIVGLIVGVIVACIICQGNYFNKGCYQGTSMMHMMPDGTMMQNHSSMSDMMNNMNASLQGKTGNDFDEAFLSEMIVHHEGAVDMAELVLRNSKRPELIKLANDIISAQTKEIKMMQDWQKSWFK